MEIIEKGIDDSSSEFVFKGEDHTLANLVCSQLRVLEEVSRVGYRLPHPLAKEVIIYVQTNGNIKPRESLLRAMNQLVDELENIVKVA